MSYCLFSSDDWRSDVYCYYGDLGIVVSVANARYSPPPTPLPPLPPPETGIDSEEWKAWFADSEAQDQELAAAERVPIGGPFDGACETFDEDSPGEAVDYLRNLIAAGYHVPGGVIEAILEDFSFTPPPPSARHA